MALSPVRYVGLNLAAFAVAALNGAGSFALAQDQQTVTVLGQAEQMCLLGDIGAGAGPVTNFDTLTGAVLTVTQLSDAQTLTTRAASINLSVDVMCNSLHAVTLSSDNNGLFRNQNIPAAGFGHAVPYQASMVWADEQGRLVADAATRQAVEQVLLVGRPHTGAMQIEIDIQAGATNAGLGYPLLAGEYSDILRLTVEPR